jgi:dipeptidyl aminopeptidase/acylaminoacyl peptidase
MTTQLGSGGALVSLTLSAQSLVAPPVTAHWSPSLSPDGGRVAYVCDRNGTPQVWVQPLDSDVARLVDTGAEPVGSVTWSPDGRWLACTLAPGAGTRTEVWLVRPDGSAPHQVAGFGSASAFLARWLTASGLLAITENGTRGLVVDPNTGESRTVAEGSLIALLDVAADGRRVLLRRGPRGARQLAVVDIVTGEVRCSGPADTGCFAPDGDSVYARSDAAADLARLVCLRPGGMEVLARRTDAEVESFAMSPDGATIAVVWNIFGGTSELTLLDVASRRQQPVAPLPGTVVSGCAFGGGRLTFTLEGPAQPPAVWVHGESGLLPVTRQTTHPSAVEPELICLPSHDGLTITGWLYRPVGCGRYPTVISLHPGPEDQERPGYNPLFQELVGHGIAVFAPNVRGSAGFGRAFLDADNGAARYGAIADVATCAQHLVKIGIAEPDRLGCMGRSYGGYLTLAALVTYPSLFAVGIDVCGMSNFETFYANTEPWIAAAAVSKYGDPVADRELLRDLSPLHRIDRLTAPLLVVHGANDTNVPVCEAEQVVAALRARGAPHWYLIFPEEGHDFLRRVNRETYLVAAVAWLTTHLGRSTGKSATGGEASGAWPTAGPAEATVLETAEPRLAS